LVTSCFRKNENWEAKLNFQAEEFLKEREQRDGEVKGWEKEKKRWKAFKTELETEVRACAAAAQETALTLVKCIAPLTHATFRSQTLS
jgi:hypothetical protein